MDAKYMFKFNLFITIILENLFIWKIRAGFTKCPTQHTKKMVSFGDIAGVVIFLIAIIGCVGLVGLAKKIYTILVKPTNTEGTVIDKNHFVLPQL